MYWSCYNYENSVMGQKAAFFEPYPENHPQYGAEGGPYGTCRATSCYPEDSDIKATSNKAYNCYYWDGSDATEAIPKSMLGLSESTFNHKDKRLDSPSADASSSARKRFNYHRESNHGLAARAFMSRQIPSCPGKLVIPFPIVCPSNLKNCYSAHYYQEGGKVRNILIALRLIQASL